MVVYLAGLRSIPRECTEAAMIDAAGCWQALLPALLRELTFW